MRALATGVFGTNGLAVDALCRETLFCIYLILILYFFFKKKNDLLKTFPLCLGEGKLV